MSLASETVNNSAIDNFIQPSLESENKNFRLEWIPWEFTDIKPTQIDNVYYDSHKVTLHNGEVKEITTMLLSLGNNEICTPTLVSELARIYSLPTYKYNDDISQFRRYSVWLRRRNYSIKGFTKDDDNY